MSVAFHPLQAMGLIGSISLVTLHFIHITLQLGRPEQAHGPCSTGKIRASLFHKAVLSLQKSHLKALLIIICTAVQPVHPEPRSMRCYMQNQDKNMFPCSNELILNWLLSNIEMFCAILRLNKQTRYVAHTQIFFNENF